MPSPLLGPQSPEKAVSSRLTSASEAAASKGPSQAALLTPTPWAVLSLQPREHQPWKMKHYGRWTQTSVYEKLLLSSVSPEMMDAAACRSWRLYHRQVERAELGLGHILTSGCFSLETSSFSNENFQLDIIYAFCIFENISIDSKMPKRAVSSMATHTLFSSPCPPHSKNLQLPFTYQHTHLSSQLGRKQSKYGLKRKSGIFHQLVYT